MVLRKYFRVCTSEGEPKWCLELVLYYLLFFKCGEQHKTTFSSDHHAYTERVWQMKKTPPPALAAREDERASIIHLYFNLQ